MVDPQTGRSKKMIAYKELNGSQSLLDNALRLLSLEPMSVSESDLVEKEICKSYHLFANDIHGIFGTATLSERPIRTLDNSLKSNMNFQERKTYYELSLVYVTTPQNLTKYSSYDKGLRTHYYQVFYQELFSFLIDSMGESFVVVKTTEKEAENMTHFGLWSFQNEIRQNGGFHGVLKLIGNNEISMNNFVFSNLRAERVLQ